jgi:hypothetical protein
MGVGRERETAVEPEDGDGQVGIWHEADDIVRLARRETRDPSSS